MTISKEDLKISPEKAVLLLGTKQQIGTEQLVSYLTEVFDESPETIWSLLEELAAEVPED